MNTKMAVPTIGIKFRGMYMKYRTSALGENFSNGEWNIFPSCYESAMVRPPGRNDSNKLTLLIASPLDFTSRPADTMPLSLRANRVPSKVSTNASATIKFLESWLMMVELSLKMRTMVENAAHGPFTKKRIDTTQPCT
jgi:hypothetical protein